MCWCLQGRFEVVLTSIPLFGPEIWIKTGSSKFHVLCDCGNLNSRRKWRFSNLAPASDSVQKRAPGNPSSLLSVREIFATHESFGSSLPE